MLLSCGAEKTLKSPLQGDIWTINLKIEWCVKWEKKKKKSPLDSKEIKPVNPKGKQAWIITGRTAAEAEAPIL